MNSINIADNAMSFFSSVSNKTLGLVRRALLLLLGAFASFTIIAQPVVTYFHNDISGSPMVATNAAGNVVWKESYRPYGEKLRNEVTNTYAINKIGFAGKPFDASTGLSYMGARYYDPVLGRFMGIDPVGFDANNIHSFNRYTYANNNPYKFVDPDGRTALVAAGVGILAIGGTYYALAPPSKQQEMRESIGRLSRAIGNVLHSESAGSGDDAKADPKNSGTADGTKPQIHEGQQGKHVKGNNNFAPGKSELTDPDPQKLLDQGAGTGQQVGNIPSGQAGSKERVDFGKTIGTYVDPATGQRSPTSIGIIHNGSRGSHIVPARPGS